MTIKILKPKLQLTDSFIQIIKIHLNINTK